MKVGSLIFVDVPSAASDMALPIDIHLPENALSRNPSSMTLLIERAAAGEASAFEQIMIHSQHRVMALSWRMLGNEADARDATQEVFLRMYKYLGRFKQDQDFFAWLYGITMNVCRTALKQRRRRNDRFESLGEGEIEDAVAINASEEDAEAVLIRAQHRQLITQAIATLPYKERASVVLRDVEGLSTDEVARILKSSSTTVRSQISSARKKIKDYCRARLGVKL
jgi:RNA polymerase sigma-70 factor (ECF subfamily)